MTDLDTTLSELNEKLAILNRTRADRAEMQAGGVTPSDPAYQASLRADVVAEDAFLQARAAALLQVAAQAAHVVRSHGYIANRAAQVLQSLLASAETDGRLFAVADAARQHITALDVAVELTDADAQMIDVATSDFVSNGGFVGVSPALSDAMGITPAAPVAEPVAEQVAA